MRHVRFVLTLLAVGIQLTACAGVQRGESDSVTWEVVDIRQSLEENGYRMRWTFALLLRNTGTVPVDFERMERVMRPGGSGDIYGGMDSTTFSRHLDPGAEFRISRNESWGCPRCPAGELPRLFSDGVVINYTLRGHDATGEGVRVLIRVRLNSSVGERK